VHTFLLQKQIYIPNDRVRLVIGAGGSKIMELRAASGCGIREERVGMATFFVITNDAFDKVLAARQLIYEAAGGLCEVRCVTFRF
jgi:hypothetical protein